jgi:hypothetical protein
VAAEGVGAAAAKEGLESAVRAEPAKRTRGSGYKARRREKGGRATMTMTPTTTWATFLWRSTR